jgi:cobalt-zinc-cadmium efflux system outer membrane protein
MNKRNSSLLLLYLFCLIFCLWIPAFSGQCRVHEALATIDKQPELSRETGISEITLEKAVAAALEHNPDLNVSKFNSRMAESEKQQASLFPNPELEYEYEDFDEPEQTLAIGYLIELGGKRKHRMQVAEAGFELASAEFDAARIEIIYETAAAYIDVFVARENLKITKEKAKLADQLYSTSRERVLAGRVSPMEQVIAEIKNNNARLEVKTAEDELLTAKTNLSAMWGGASADFTTAGDSFERIQPIPPFEELMTLMDHSPIIKIKLSEIKIAETSLDFEKSNRIPDFTVYGGIKRIDESDDPIYFAGLSVPVPLFDRNQAGVARAAAELNQQAAGLTAEKNRLVGDLKNAYQKLNTAYMHVNSIQSDILPAARQVLDAVKEGYREGEFSFPDMLEAQSTLYESHESYIHSLGQYHIAFINLEKLLGRNLGSTNRNPSLIK